ncbi:MAG: hypothetical protein U9Q27_03480 [Patescibacteria group bacterium]|nr:hypothetical protein [Patescibacteria group bacterium]
MKTDKNKEIKINIMITLEDLQIGMTFIITKEGEQKYGWGPEGSKAIIKAIKIDTFGKLIVGMYFEKPCNPAYHSLNDLVEHGHGYWLTLMQLLSNSSFRFLPENIILNPDIKLKEKNIGNKEGRILKHIFDTKYIMVELLDNVGGCSGDGIGKAGHCVILNKDKIRYKRKENEICPKKKSG